MPKIIAVLCASLIYAFAALPAAAGSRSMSAAAIKSLFPGTFEAMVKGGYGLRLKVRRNGTLKATAILGISDKGRWSFNRRALCITFKKWTRGKRKCGVVRKSGVWYVATRRGVERFRFRRNDIRVAQGN